MTYKPDYRSSTVPPITFGSDSPEISTTRPLPIQSDWLRSNVTAPLVGQSLVLR